MWGSLPIRPETFSFCDSEEDSVDYDGCYYDDNGCQNNDDEDDKDNYQVKVTLTYSAVVDGSESDDYLKAVEEPLGKDWKAKTHEKRNFCT